MTFRRETPTTSFANWLCLMSSSPPRWRFTHSRTTHSAMKPFACATVSTTPLIIASAPSRKHKHAAPDRKTRTCTTPSLTHFVTVWRCVCCYCGGRMGKLLDYQSAVNFLIDTRAKRMHLSERVSLCLRESVRKVRLLVSMFVSMWYGTESYYRT